MLEDEGAGYARAFTTPPDVIGCWVEECCGDRAWKHLEVPLKFWPIGIRQAHTGTQTPGDLHTLEDLNIHAYATIVVVEFQKE